MSLFSKAGAKFEVARQAFIHGNEGEYVCQSCDEAVTEAYEYCPHCGEGSVEPVE